MAAVLGALMAPSESSTPAGAQTGASGAWTIATFAGSGIVGQRSSIVPTGDGGSATLAQLAAPWGITGDSRGNIYITEFDRVRKIDPVGTITTTAGGGSPPDGLGDGGPATQARLNLPSDLAVAQSGDLYIADREHHRVRVVDTAGRIRTIAGTGTAGSSPSELNRPLALALDTSEHLYVVEDSRVRRVNGDGQMSTVAGVAETSGYSGDGGPATLALVNPHDVTFDAAGNLYVADGDNHRVRKIVPGSDGVVNGGADETITTVAGGGAPLVGGFGGDGGPATSAQLNRPTGIEVDGAGNLFIADTDNRRIRRVDTSGTITTVAGTGLTGYSGDGGPAKSALLRYPGRVYLDTARNLLIADAWNNRVRRVPTAVIVVDVSPDPADEGQSLSYTVGVGGFATDASGVELTQVLPQEVSYASATSSQGACSQSGGTVTCDLGTVATGQSVTVRIAGIAVGPGLVVSTATVTADAGAVAYNDTVTTPTRVSAADCGQLVSATTTLARDIGPCARNGLVVAADNITVDLNGHHVFGFPGPSDGSSAGVRLAPAGPGLPGRSNVTVTRGTVSDFDAGVALFRSSDNTVTNLVVRDNLGPDDVLNPDLEFGDGIVLFESARNKIIDNDVLRNGVFDGIGVLGGDSDGNVIVGNTIEDTVGPTDGGPSGQGIIINAAAVGENLGQTIDGTTIHGNQVRRSASAGVSNLNHVGGTIKGNTVEANGRTNSVGNGIGIQLGPRALVTATRLLVEDNEVHGNGVDGIRITSGPRENVIQNNNVTGNNVNPSVNWYESHRPGFDLRDAHFGNACGSNTWRDNIWGSGGYSPECTTAGTPDTTVTAGPSGLVNDATPTVEFSSDRPNVTFACAVDGAGFASCTSPHTISALPDGLHVFEVKATETYSGSVDESPARVEFTVDTTAPETTITAGPSGPTADDTPTFEFSANEVGSTFVCRVDDGAFAPCTSPHTTPPLPPGGHTVEVRATDPAGNSDQTPAAWPFTVVTPVLGIADAAAAEGNKGSTSLTFTVSLSPASANPVSVHFATSNGTATAKTDYKAASGTLSFAPGETTKTIVVSVRGDNVKEPDELFFVNLFSPANATIANGQAVGTIRNDDG